MSYAKLRGKIREKFGTQGRFGMAMTMSATTLSKKLSGETDWTRAEIVKACELLDIPLDNAHAYFFAL